MRLKIENITNNTTKNSLRRDRNEIMKTIHRKMKKLDEQKLENCLKEIENSKNDSWRMFRVIKEIQRQKPKITLLIKTEIGGFTINKKEQAKIVAAHFKKQLSKNTLSTKQNPLTANSDESAINCGRNNHCEMIEVQETIK